MTNKSHSDSCYLTLLTANGIIRLIYSIKNNVKSGDDQITSEIVKPNNKYLIDLLLHVMNCIFSNRFFPCILKMTIGNCSANL